MNVEQYTSINDLFKYIFLCYIYFYKKVVAVPQVFDLGADGKGMKYVACMSEDSMAHKAASTTRYIYTMYIYTAMCNNSHTTAL